MPNTRTQLAPLIRRLMDADAALASDGLSDNERKLT
jgi:hypothetical protein